MAQTRRKRKSKHRGNAAGTVEARGRTSRPPSEAERKKRAKEVARANRLDKPPTWASSSRRALLAGGFMFLFLFLVGGGKHTSSTARLVDALLFAVIAVALYIPLGYWMESFLYRRRQAKKALSQ
jgi:hypothetical protein